MIIASTKGKILYTSGHRTLKRTLEDCAHRGLDLSFACLRRGRLRKAALDGLVAPGANFWGCDLGGADIGWARLSHADFRHADLTDACFSQSDLTGADLRGACFTRVLLGGAVLDDVQISCPSFFNCDLEGVASMKNLTYHHRGEVALKMDMRPIVVDGLGAKLVIGRDFCLWGDRLFNSSVSEILQNEKIADL